MKLKNHYAWLLPFGIISTIYDCVGSVVNFVDSKIVFGFIFLVLSISFSFVSGILLEKALVIHKHNKTCDWLHELAQELAKEEIEQIKPFEEFEK